MSHFAVRITTRAPQFETQPLTTNTACLGRLYTTGQTAPCYLLSVKPAIVMRPQQNRHEEKTLDASVTLSDSCVPADPSAGRFADTAEGLTRSPRADPFVTRARTRSAQHRPGPCGPMGKPQTTAQRSGVSSSSGRLVRLGQLPDRMPRGRLSGVAGDYPVKIQAAIPVSLTRRYAEVPVMKTGAHSPFSGTYGG